MVPTLNTAFGEALDGISPEVIQLTVEAETADEAA